MNKKQVSKITRKKLELRKKLWPKHDPKQLWDRTKTQGWLTIPKSMPLVLRIMDTLSKGKPVSSAYLDLWCRTYEDSFIIANKHSEMAFASGFNGERAIRTWKDRIQTLEKLGFIKVCEGPSGPISYILVLNPFHVIQKLEKQIDASSFNALTQRMIELGADDMEK